MFLEQQISILEWFLKNIYFKKHLKSYQSQTFEWLYIMWIGLSSLNPKKTTLIQIKTFNPPPHASVLFLGKFIHNYAFGTWLNQ